MRILIIHNSYGKFSGEEAVVQSQISLLQDNGHQVLRYERSSAEIPEMYLGTLRAFFSGIYSFYSRRQIRELLAEHKPDIVHVHNVFPLISPSIFVECRKARVSVVMTAHNYRLICPNGLFITKGQICEKCRNGKEYNCLLNNCENNYFKSFGYFLRNYFARKFGFFKNNVTVYATLTEFHRNKMISEGIPENHIVCIPNMVDTNSGKNLHPLGDYVAFVGRLSREKGIETLIMAARKCPSITFRLAGNYEKMPHLPDELPNNCELVGYLDRKELEKFYLGCRILIMPSICYETFGLCLAEAMVWGKPTICSRIGALEEIVDDGITGILFEPGNAHDLAEKIDYLWNRPDLCRLMGLAGREKALREYSPEKYYQRLMTVYNTAIELESSGPHS